MARAALIEKQKLEDIIKSLHTGKLVHETIEKLTSEIGKLEAKVETRAKQQALMIRNNTASNRRDVQASAFNKTHEAMAKFEQFSRKVDELEAEADVYAKTGNAKSLDQEFCESTRKLKMKLKKLAKLKQQVENRDK